MWDYFTFGFKNFGIDIIRRFYLDAKLIYLKPDILHYEFGALSVDHTYLKELLNLKMSVSFRGFDLNFVAIENPNYYSELWEIVDACHFISKDLLEQAVLRGFPKIKPYMIIQPAVDLSKFNINVQRKIFDNDVQNKPFNILSIGRLERKKGYQFALPTVKKLKDNGIYYKYRIVGSGSYQSELMLLCEQLDLEDEVTFLGDQMHNRVVQELAMADVLFHPSLSEGFCNAVLEAQAMKVPVVCSDAGGLPENVLDGVTGFIVPMGDSEAMAEKLTLLAQDQALRQKMGGAGRKRVEIKFNIEDQISAFEEFYGRL